MAEKQRKEASLPLAAVPMAGRADEKARMIHALERSCLPQSILLTGAPASGKKRFAHWLATAILCEHSSACGTCDSCRKSASLMHPDLHLFLPHKSPGSADQEGKVAASIEESLAQVRENAFYQLPQSGTAYYVATVRHMAQEAAKKAWNGAGRKVFIVSEAELLVPREGSAEAANALLKLIEEPPAGTYWIFTAASRHGVIETVRSRMVEIRLPPLDATTIRTVLVQSGMDDAMAEEGAASAGGTLRGLLGEGAGERAELRKAAMEWLISAIKGDGERVYDLALAQGASGARGAFLSTINETAAIAAACARLAAGNTPGDKLALQLQRDMKDAFPGAKAWSSVMLAAESAAKRARANVTPILVLHSLLSDSSRALTRSPRQS